VLRHSKGTRGHQCAKARTPKTQFPFGVVAEFHSSHIVRTDAATDMTTILGTRPRPAAEAPSTSCCGTEAQMAGLTAEPVICVVNHRQQPLRLDCCDDHENPGIQVRPIRRRELRVSSRSRRPTGTSQVCAGMPVTGHVLIPLEVYSFRHRK
jgi:hypothetical protein